MRFSGHVRKVHLALLTAALLAGGAASNVTAAPSSQACDDGPRGCGPEDAVRRQGRFWSLTGNSGTNSSVNFLGTLDDQALQLRVNNQRVLLLVPSPTSPDVVGGFEGNSVAPGIRGATVGGGGENTHPNAVNADFGTIGGGLNNTLDGPQATIAGGSSNQASGMDAAICGGVNNVASGFVATVCGGDSNHATGSWSFATGRANTASGLAATVGGGHNNQASRDESTISGGQGNTASAPNATVGGGQANSASAFSATVAGGRDNLASGFAFATVGGGFANRASGENATIGGGFDNVASGPGATIAGGGDAVIGNGNRVSSANGTVGGGSRNQVGDATGQLGAHGVVAGGVNNRVTGTAAAVAGGDHNLAQGDRSFAAGVGAKALHAGAFVWADSTFTDRDFTSTAANEFSVRATGGARFVSAVAADGSPTAGVTLAPGGGSWSSLSDRAVKTNIAPIDHRALLERLFRVPIETWSYTSQDPSIRHVGPMAQDFAAAFGLGEDERYIDSVDAQGIALASIQGLYELVQEKDAQIAAQQLRIAALEQQVTSLDARLSALERGTHPGTGLPDSWPIIGGVLLAGLAVKRFTHNV